MVLVISILVNLSFGAVEFGYYFFVKNTMQGAAREGARAAIVAGATDSAVDSAVNSALSAAGMDAANFVISISPDLSTSPTAGTYMTVTVTEIWGTIGQGFRPLSLIGGGKTVLAAAVMRKEG